MTAQTILPANSVTGGFEVANSGRFNIGSSDHLTRSLGGSPTSTRKATWSYWVKRSALTSSASEMIYSNEVADDNNRGFIQFEDDDTFRMTDTVSSTQLITNRLFRDVSAFYHIVLAIDTTQGTAANRIKLYVNGVQETSFATASYPDQNDDLKILTGGQTNKQHISKVHGGSGYFGGYLSEFVFIDGLQLAADQFGEFDEDSGIWKPINVSGLTFGNEGFYLNFQTAAELGDDVSGNTNDFSESNLTALDQSTDTCTNNFATMLPLTKSTDATLSEGNLNVTYGTASTRRAIFGSIVVTAGKWFCETKIIATSQTSVEMNLGISNTYDPEAIGNALISTNGFTVSLFPSNGSLYIGSTRDEQGLGNLAVNDIIGMAINIDDGTLQFYKNGSALGSANDITTGDSDDGELYPGFTIANSCSSGGQTFTASHNFGSPAYSESGGNSDASGFGNFSMSVPSGFFSICTKNLAEYGG